MSPLDVSSFPDSVQLPTEQDRTNSIPSRSHRRRLFGSLLGGTKDVAQLWRAPRRRASEASVQVIPTESEPQTVLDLRSSEAPLAAPAHAGHPSEERAALPLTLATSTTELIVSPRDNPVSESPENLFPPTPVAEDFPEKNHVKESIKALRLSRIHRAQDWARKPEDDALPPWASRGVIDSFGLPDDYRDEREADRTRMSSGTTGSSSTSSWRPSAPSSPSTSRSSYWSAATSSTAATPTSPWSAKPRGSGLSTSIAPSRPFSGVSSQSSKSARSGKSGKRPVTPPHLSGGAMMRLRSLSSSSDKGKDKAPSTPPNTLDPRPRTLSGGPGPVASAAGQPVVAAAARSKSTTRSRTHSNPEDKSRAASSILTAPSPSRSVATPTLSTSQSSAGSRPLPDVPSVRPPQTIKSTKQQPSPIGPRQAGKHKHSVPARPEEGIPTPAGYETSTIAAFPSSHKASSLPAPLNGANTSPQIRQTPLPPTDPSIIHAPINPSRIKPGGPSRSVPVTSPTFASTGDVSSRDPTGSTPTATSTAHPLCPISPSEPEHVMAPWSLKPRTSNSGGLTSPTPSSSSLPHRSYESLRAYGRSFGHSARASVASSPSSPPPRSHSPVNMFTTVPEAAVSSDLPMLPTSSGSLGQRSTPSFASSTTSKRSASPVNMYSNMDSLFGTAPKPRPLVKLDKSKKDKGKQTQRSPEPSRPVEPQRSPEPRRAPEPRPSVSRAPQPSASRPPQPSVARASSASARIGRSSGSLMRRPKTSESQSAQPRASTSSRYRSTRPSTANSTGSAASDTTIPIAFLNGDPVYTDTPRKVNLSRASVWGPTRPSTGGSHVEPPPLVEPGATPLGEQPVNVVVQSREKGVWEERDVQDVIYQLRKIRAK
ncbi:hypothetical protein PENSPDRAFT_375708 [Peniophora sp. CONT]|nr:hypothetical protein PENSPDRAFT_375708 [Peniophora sp. CONT]